MTIQNVYEKALETWGKNAQMMQFVVFCLYLWLQ